MLFNSLIFIYFFLPICLLLTILVPRKLKNPMMLLASFMFYAWGGVSYTLVLFGSIVLNYIMGFLIDRSTEEGRRRKMFVIGLILNLLLLGIFKYSGFMADNVNVLTEMIGLKPFVVKHILLPLGISFFTFKAITYLISVRQRETPFQKNFIDLGLYIAIFPQLLAGPIDRYKNLSIQISNRKLTFEQFASGTGRFILGLAKKVLIAGQIALVTDKIFATPDWVLNAPMAWLGAICYTLQIYYDFSGYTDMAIGLGRMFGFEFPENFRYPYVARSIRDFWRRWHITLSTWLHDYLFVPLAYASLRSLKRERYLGIRSDNVVYVYATMITFLLCGFWHGAAWQFIAWGMLHGLMLSLERTPFGKWLERGTNPLSHVYVLLFLTVTMVFFRAGSFRETLDYLGVMFGLHGGPVVWVRLLEYVDYKFLLVLLVAVLWATPVFDTIAGRMMKVQTGITGTLGTMRIQLLFLCRIAALVSLLLLSTLYLVSQTNSPFIYFRF